MSFQAIILNRAGHVGEHIVAICLVSGAEVAFHKFVEQFGLDLHQWPVVIYVALAGVIYLGGFITARIIRRAIQRHQGIGKMEALSAPPEILEVPMSEPKDGGFQLKAEDKYVAAALGAALILSAAAVLAARRAGDAVA